jgi:hypothetical protein
MVMSIFKMPPQPNIFLGLSLYLTPPKISVQNEAVVALELDQVRSLYFEDPLDLLDRNC